MTDVRTLLSRLGDLVFRRPRDRRLDDEMAFHLAALEDELKARGMAPNAARLEARRQFGGVDQTKMRCRDQRGLPGLAAFEQDVRVAGRLLLRDRWSAAATIVSLAAGMAGAATMVSIIYSLNVRALPFDEPERVVAVRGEPNRAQRSLIPLTVFEAWRDAVTMLDGMAAHTGAAVSLGDDTHAADQLSGQFISHNLLATLRVRPLVGRDFRPEDDRRGAAPVALLGYRAWVDRYGSDPAIVGRTVRANSVPATIVGVMPEGFLYPVDTQIWLPLSALPAARAPGGGPLVQIVARLKDGVQAGQARGELAALTPAMAAVSEADRARQPDVLPLNEAYFGAALQTTPVLMIAATLIVLLIACSHAASLQVARSAARAREMAMRTALGASRARLVRQLLIESTVIALAAGVVAAAIATIGMDRFAKETVDAGMPYWTRFTLDARLVLGLAGLSVLVGIAFGLLPALQISRANLGDVLGQGGRPGTVGPGAHRTTSWLLAVELAMTIVLLGSAAALVQSASVLYEADRALDLDNLWEFRLNLPQPQYASRSQRLAFYQRLDERLAVAPGAELAALASSAPFLSRDERAITMDGAVHEPGTAAATAQVVAIGPRYFQTLGLRMVAGRGLDEVDASALTSSVLVNEHFVARYSPGVDPLGREVTIVNDRVPGSTPLRGRIAGIAPPLRQAINVAGSPVVYVAHAAEPLPAASIVIRGHPDRFAERLRQEVRELDPDLPLFRLQSLERASSLSRWIPRVTSTAFSATAIVATLLSALGIYSITALAAAQRTREVGVRLALGASPGRILRLFLVRILWPLSIGVVTGLAGAVGAGRALQGLLVDVRANDPMVLAAVCVLLVIVAVIAGLRPALGAARLDPATTLRAE